MTTTTCFLCFRLVGEDNSQSDSKYYEREYKEKLIQCCHRLLGVKMEKASNLKYSTISSSPFCMTCFQSSENLWEAEEITRNSSNKEILKTQVDNFTSEILQFRLGVLSKNIDSESEDDIDGGDYQSNVKSHNFPCNNIGSSAPVLTIKAPEITEGGIKVEVIDIIDDPCVIDSKNVDNFDKDLNPPSPFKNLEVQNRSNSFSSSQYARNCNEVTLPELRVVLERLQFDANGEIKQPINSNKDLRKRKAAIEARSLVSKSISSEVPWDDDLLNVSRITISDNDEFISGDVHFDSDLSEDDTRTIKKSASWQKTKSLRRNDNKGFKRIKKVAQNRKPRPAKSNRKYSKTPGFKIQMKRKKIYFNFKTKVKTELKCGVCLYTFKLSRELDFHSDESGHINERLFKCSQCSKSYYRLDDLNSHKYFCTYTNRKCRHCKKVLLCPTLSSFHRHVRHHEKKQRSRKPSRKSPFKSSTGKRNKEELSTKYKCVVCSLVFKKSKYILEHIEKEGHANKPLFLCDKCPKKYFIKSDLLTHDRNNHELFLRTCKLCNREFTNRVNYYTHRFFHKKEQVPKKLFNCTQCVKTFTSVNNFKLHVQTHAGYEPHKCDKCDAAFASKATLIRHKSGHKRNLPFQCEICLVFCRTDKGLRRHTLQSHPDANQEKTFKCDLCEMSFGELKHIIAHHITDHGLQSPFVCKHCKVVFNYRNDLIAHLKTVHQENTEEIKSSLSCEFCGKEYKCPRDLVIHTLTHSDTSGQLVKKLRPKMKQKGSYQCEDCGKIFAYKYGLADHWNRVHSPDAESKRMTCNICGKVLADARLFKNHQAVHNKKFQCDLCGRQFSENLSLQGHVKRIHEQNKTPRKPYTRTANPKPRWDHLYGRHSAAAFTGEEHP